MEEPKASPRPSSGDARPRRPSQPERAASSPDRTGEMELPRLGHGRAPLGPRASHPSHASVHPPPPKGRGARVWHALKHVLLGLYAHHAFEAAASIAFWFFLSLIPLLVFIGWLFGQFVRSKGLDTMLEPLIAIVPGQDAENLLRGQLERMAGGMADLGGGPVAPLAIAGFLWTSSSGLHNLMDIFELAVRVPRRPYWKKRVLAIAWVVVGLLAAVGTTFSLTRLDAVVHADERAAVTAPSAEPEELPRGKEKARWTSAPSAPRETPRFRTRFAELWHTPWERIAAVLAMLAIGTTLLAQFYRYAVKHPAGVKRRAWPGAFVAVGVWLLGSWGFGEYVATLGGYAVYYGGLAAVAVLLVWLYLTSLALVLGAEVNAQLEGVRG